MTTPEGSQSVAGLLATGMLVQVAAADRAGVAGAARAVAAECLLEASVASSPILALTYAMQACQAAVESSAAAAGYTLHAPDGVSEADLDDALTSAAGSLPGAGDALRQLREAWERSLLHPTQVDCDAAIDTATRAVAALNAP